MNWLLSEDFFGFQLGAWRFQTSSKNKINNAENVMKVLEDFVEMWMQTYLMPLSWSTQLYLKKNNSKCFVTVHHENSQEYLFFFFFSSWNRYKKLQVTSICILKYAIHSLRNGKYQDSLHYHNVMANTTTAEQQNSRPQ